MYSSFCLTWVRSLVFPGEIGPADEFSARLDIEVDSPGPSHVIKCVPIRARSGTARVHAPKDLQVYKHLYYLALQFFFFYTKSHFNAFLISQAWFEKTKHNSSKNKKKCEKWSDANESQPISDIYIHIVIMFVYSDLARLHNSTFMFLSFLIQQ